MRRILFGLLLFVLILGAGVILTVSPGSDAAYEAAVTRITAAREERKRILKFDDLTNLGALPPELGALTEVIQLDLRNTVISDIAVLSGMENLQILSLRGTLVDDLTPVTKLPRLDTLDIGESWVRDLSPLEYAPALRRLDIAMTWVDSLAPLTRMPNLQWVNMHGAFATDGSTVHLESLQDRGVTTNNGRAFGEDYHPGWLFRQKVRLQRLMRRTRLGLGVIQ